MFKFIFLFAHAVAAQLNSAGVMSLSEGQNISVDLEAGGNDPFSPVVTFQWMHNGAELNLSNLPQRISIISYTISITGVQREDAGVYRLVVCNSGCCAVGNFTLDVLCKLVCYQIAIHNLVCLSTFYNKKAFFLLLSICMAGLCICCCFYFL